MSLEMEVVNGEKKGFQGQECGDRQALLSPLADLLTYRIDWKWVISHPLKYHQEGE